MQSIVLDLGRTPFLLYANTFLWMSQTKLCLAEIKHSQASFFLKRKPLKKSLVLSLWKLNEHDKFSNLDNVLSE